MLKLLNWRRLLIKITFEQKIVQMYFDSVYNQEFWDSFKLQVQKELKVKHHKYHCYEEIQDTDSCSSERQE